MSKWGKDEGTADLTKVAVTGQLPTLSVGDYTGIFVGATSDSGGAQWITVATSNGSHTEQNDLDVSDLNLNDKIEFSIKAQQGAGLVIKGSRYKLLSEDRVSLTGWTQLGNIYTYVIQNNVRLAGPRLVKLTKVN